MKNNYLIFFLIVLISTLILVNFFTFNESNQKKVIINGEIIYVDVAKTPEELAQGLSGRPTMAPNQGMLFVFNEPGRYVFWMKDMKFSLDFLYINGDTIVTTVENVPYPKSGGKPKVLQAPKDFDKVLEINAGTAKRLKIGAGDKVEIK